MSSYFGIVSMLEAQHIGSGMAESQPGTLARQRGVPIACKLRTALTIDWMIAKKKGVSFWLAKNAGESASDALFQLNGVASEREHGDMLWQRAMLQLSGHGLHLVSSVNHVPGNPDLANVISHFALNYREHYHVLSMPSEQTRHDIALYRPWKRVGKSRLIHVYDPNFGEFHVNDEGLIQILQVLLQEYAPQARTLVFQRFSG